MDPQFFANRAEFRAWLEAHHADEPEVVVGYYRKASARTGMTWQESVDEALCFGWIDGIRRRIDDESYSNRFTPRRPRSNWSAINIKRAQELIEEGRMTPAGLAAFEARTDDRSAIYSYEQRHEARLDAEQERRFRAHAAAWEWFQSRPPSFPPHRGLLGHERDEARDARAAAGDADRGRRRRPHAQVADASRQSVIRRLRPLPTDAAAPVPTTAR